MDIVRRYQCTAVLLAVVLFMGSAWPSGSCLAQASEAAMSALKLAKHHYKKDNFKKAALLFKEAFDIDPNPLFLYNAGRALQRGFMLEDAEKTLNKFLQLEAEGKHVGADHQAASKRAKMHLQEIATTKAQLKQAHASGREEATAETKPTPAPVTKPQGGKPAPVVPASTPKKVPATASPSKSWLRPAGWGLVGLGVVALGYGVWELNEVSDRSADLYKKLCSVKVGPKCAGMDQKSYRAAQDIVAADQTAAFAVIGLAVVSGGIGGYLLWTSPVARTVTLGPFASGRGLRVSMRF